MKVYESEAKLFKVLMHPARLAILDLLRSGEECVCHMESLLGYRQAYISQQLMILRDAGLVEDRRDGWNIFYRVTNPLVYAVIDAALAMSGGAGTTIPVVLRKAAILANCPCPKCSRQSEKAPP